MDKSEILLLANSILLDFVSLLLLVVGYFLKDLYKDFKQMAEQVNRIDSEQNTHISNSKDFKKGIENKIGYLDRQVKRLNLRRKGFGLRSFVA